MARTTTTEKTLAAVRDGRVKASKLPELVRFPLLLLLSLTLSSLGYSVVAPWVGGELAGVSRRLEGWEEVGGLVCVRG